MAPLVKKVPDPCIRWFTGLNPACFRVQGKSVLFNLFVIMEPLIYFHVVMEPPLTQILKNTNYLKENQIFHY